MSETLIATKQAIAEIITAAVEPVCEELDRLRKRYSELERENAELRAELEKLKQPQWHD